MILFIIFHLLDSTYMEIWLSLVIGQNIKVINLDNVK